MADPFTAIAVGSTLLSFAGGMQQASAAKQAGKDELAMSEFVANQNRVAAGQERASSQRDAIEQRRKGRLVQSKFINQAAASGNSTLDPTTTNLFGDIAKESEYNAMSALYAGEDRARGLETKANVGIYEGQAANRAAKAKSSSLKTQAFGSLLSGAADSGMMGKYNPTSSKEVINWNSPRKYN